MKKIRVCNVNGVARVEVTGEESDEVLSCVEVEDGQEVNISASTPGTPEVEVGTVEAAQSDTAAEPDAA